MGGWIVAAGSFHRASCATHWHNLDKMYNNLIKWKVIKLTMLINRIYTPKQIFFNKGMLWFE